MELLFNLLSFTFSMKLNNLVKGTFFSLYEKLAFLVHGCNNKIKKMMKKVLCHLKAFLFL